MIDTNTTEVLKVPFNFYFDHVPASLILGMTYGIKSNLQSVFYTNIKNAGLSHVIVFSGSNIAILFTIISQLLFFIRNKSKILIASFILMAFLLLLPREPSILRATTMWITTVLAKLLDKKTNKFYVFILTLLVLTITDPNIITNISFQLSASAVLGILIFESDMEANEAGILTNFMKDLKTTISAQVFTVPLIYYYFNNLNPLSSLANILITPIVRPMIYIGIITPFLYLLQMPSLFVINNIASLISQYFIIVVNIFNIFAI